jgi:LacI family transcriptional regulator
MLPGVMAVTMLDIARDLNVSVVTVSKVLRNTGAISMATRKRVLRRAKQLNYQTNCVARSLVTRRTFTIGLLLPDFTHPFFAEVARAVAATVRPRGYHVIISYYEEEPRLERAELESLVARQIDGLIVASAQSPEHAGLFKRLRKSKLAFVLIDRLIAGVDSSCVLADNEGIGRLAAKHLIAQGCRRLAHLRGPATFFAAARMAGYQREIERQGLELSPRHIAAAGFTDDTGYKAMCKLLRITPPPDAVFCYSDPVAIGAMKAITDTGLRIPEDVAIIGAGNIRYSDILGVPLTTIDQGTAEMGRQAAELLLEQMSTTRQLRPRKVVVPAQLIIRQSTQRKDESLGDDPEAQEGLRIPSRPSSASFFKSPFRARRLDASNLRKDS